MKFVALTLLFSLLSQLLASQYYYKDQVLPKQTMDQMKKLKEAKVRSVKLNSAEGNGRPVEDLLVEQTINNSYTLVTTNTSSSSSNTSTLKTWYDNNGRIIKTTDTTDGFSSTTEYIYNSNNQVSSITNTAISAGQRIEKEEHVWVYNSEGKPLSMNRIKNNSDTLYVSFTLDENGNVTEENSRRYGLAQSPIYYYYNNLNQLTDVVRYNRKAKRLLPDYMFEYNKDGQLLSMVIVPEGSDDYQRWVYQYNDQGLKTRETVVNKRKQVLGRVDYVYGKQ